MYSRQSNPICQSLIKFSRILTSMNDNEPNIDEVRADFARNGRDCDENDDKTSAIKEAKKVHLMLRQSLIRSAMRKTLRRQTHKSPVHEKYCVFCQNNGEPAVVVRSHTVRDSDGCVICPRLRDFVCPICGGTGDNAHTIKYCPEKPIITMQDTIDAEKTRRISHFKQGLKWMY